jgi:hypothetical protein
MRISSVTGRPVGCKNCCQYEPTTGIKIPPQVFETGQYQSTQTISIQLFALFGQNRLYRGPAAPHHAAEMRPVPFRICVAVACVSGRMVNFD